ncbi:hypothetical protein PI125_g1601 [Phytophthora idaei]|nr:hypothetical protein PI125_g1601 [Phytophthora idaei]
MKKHKFTKGEIKKIECSLIEFHADNHLADRFIEQSSPLRFLELLCPGITDILPSRRILSSRILKEHAKRCETMDTEDLKATEERTKGWVNLLSDGRLTRMKPGEFLDSPWEYWEGVALEKPKSLLPKLAMRVLSIAVNNATCERLFSGLGLIHTAKRNSMAASKAHDFHIVAKHVRQRAQKDAAAFESPKKKLLISPKERQIIHDTANSSSLFTPSPQQRGAVNAGEDSDSEDPGDGVDGDPALSL